MCSSVNDILPEGVCFCLVYSELQDQWPSVLKWKEEVQRKRENEGENGNKGENENEREKEREGRRENKREKVREVNKMEERERGWACENR